MSDDRAEVPGVYEPRTNRPTPAWVTVVDVVALVLLLLGIYATLGDGFAFRLAGLRVTLNSPWRPLLWACGLLIVRHAIVRRPSLPERLWTGGIELLRPKDPLPDDHERFALPPSMRSSAVGRLRTVVWVSLFFIAATALMTYPQVMHIHDGVGADLADPLLSTWRLSWFAHQLPRDPLNLFNANIFHPEPRTLAFSDAMLVPSLTVAPLVWLGLHQVAAYNLLFLSGFFLSGVGMFVLVRSLTHHTGAALLAGFIYAFLPYRFMHYSHLELQMGQWMPLGLWALHRTITRGRVGDGLLTGLFFALQMLSSVYYGVFFATYLAVVGGALLLAAGSARVRASVKPLLAGGLLAAALVGPLLVPYLGARSAVGERPVHEIEYYSATPQHYLEVHPRNAAFGPRHSQRGNQEKELFQGFAVPIVALLCLWPPLSAVRIAYALGLLAALEISFGMFGFTFPLLHEYALPYRGLRVPARMALLVGMTLAVMVGFSVARFSRKIASRRDRYGALALLFLLVFYEYRSRLTLEDVWPEPPPVYAALGANPDTVLLELPLIIPDIALEPTYMYFSTFHWHKLVNGYSGFQPPSYVRLIELMRTFPDDASFAELRHRGVTHILVHGALFRPGDYLRVTTALEARPEVTLSGVYRWQGADTRMYRVSK